MYHRLHGAEMARQIAIVGIEEADIASSRCIDADVPRPARTAVLTANDSETRVVNHLTGAGEIICRAVIDDDDLDIGDILRENGVYRIDNQVSPIINRDHYRKKNTFGRRQLALLEILTTLSAKARYSWVGKIICRHTAMPNLNV